MKDRPSKDAADDRARQLGKEWPTLAISKQQEFLENILNRVTIGQTKVWIEIDKTRLLATLLWQKPESLPAPRRCQVRILKIAADFQILRRGGELRVITPQDSDLQRECMPSLVKTVARARGWYEQIVAGEVAAVFDIKGETAVGYFDYDPTSSSSNQTAFVLSGGVYRLISIPGAVSSVATGINSSGQIVGYYTDSSDTSHAFYDSAGTIETVDNTAGTGTIAFDINDSGEIVGAFADSSGNVHGYVDVGGTFTKFDDPNVVNGTYGVGINDSGEIVGWWEDSLSVDHGYILSGIGGTFTEVDFPLATNTQLGGVNNGGEVSGYYQDASNVNHGLIYSDGAYAEVDVVGASGTEVLRIKNNGAITGAFIDTLGEFHGLQGH